MKQNVELTKPSGTVYIHIRTYLSIVSNHEGEVVRVTITCTPVSPARQGPAAVTNNYTHPQLHLVVLESIQRATPAAACPARQTTKTQSRRKVGHAERRPAKRWLASTGDDLHRVTRSPVSVRTQVSVLPFADGKSHLLRWVSMQRNARNVRNVTELTQGTQRNDVIIV